MDTHLTNLILQCSKCGSEPEGDYYQARHTTLCVDCYCKLSSTRGFIKVRDCRTIHKHEFPGREPKIIVKTEKQLKKQRLREAYLRQYYS